MASIDEKTADALLSLLGQVDVIGGHIQEDAKLGSALDVNGLREPPFLRHVRGRLLGKHTWCLATEDADDRAVLSKLCVLLFQQ